MVKVDPNPKRRSSNRLHAAALATILAVFGNAFIASEYSTRMAEPVQSQDDPDGTEQISDLPAFCGFYFHDDVEYEETMAAKAFVPENKECFAKLREAFAALEPFEPAPMEIALKGLA